MDFNDSRSSDADEELDYYSPPSGAENLFLAGLVSPDVALERRPRQNSNGSSRISVHSGASVTSRGTISTVDFLSCAEHHDLELDSVDTADSYNNKQQQKAMRNYSPVTPFVARSSRLTTADDISKISSNYGNINSMSTSVMKTSKMGAVPLKKFPGESVAGSAKEAPVASTSTDMDLKIDPAEVVYGKAKEVLEWGKTVPVVSNLVGISEVLAGKALEVVGTDLPAVDGQIANSLLMFDEGVLNPAISAIAKVLIGVAGKSEETLMPIITAILKPLGMIKSDANEQTPGAHTGGTPELTTESQ